MRPGQADVAETRQGAIGAGLLENGIRPLYADVWNPKSYTSNGTALQQWHELSPDDPGRLIPITNSDPIRPDAYRLRDVPQTARARLFYDIPGYNNGELCSTWHGREALQFSLFRLLGNVASTPDYTVLRPGDGPFKSFSHMPGDMLFAKPAARGAYTDVGRDMPKLARRTRYVHRDKVPELLADAAFSGGILLQPDIAAPVEEIAQRLGIDTESVPDFAARKHHTIRIYELAGSVTDTVISGRSDVAEVRLVGPNDIGNPEPSYYRLYEPEQVLEVFPEVRNVHDTVRKRVQECFGLNYYAADYFLSAKDGAMVDALHTRPWLPSIGDDPLSRRTVATEVNVLTRLATTRS